MKNITTYMFAMLALIKKELNETQYTKMRKMIQEEFIKMCLISITGKERK